MWRHANKLTLLATRELGALATDLGLKAAAITSTSATHGTNATRRESAYSGKDSMKSKMFALRHASSISSCVTSDAGFVAPRRILKRIVPAYNVCNSYQHPHIYTHNLQRRLTGSCDTSAICLRYSVTLKS